MPDNIKTKNYLRKHIKFIKKSCDIRWKSFSNIKQKNIFKEHIKLMKKTEKS